VLVAAGGMLLLPAGCDRHKPAKKTALSGRDHQTQAVSTIEAGDPNHPRPTTRERLDERRRMVSMIADNYGLTDPNILRAMLNVPRHWFVPAGQQRYAYDDRPLPIGHGQTISQPFIVAFMTWLLKLNEHKKILEIGTGSGYQAAVLNEFTPYVYTIEILEPLGKEAQHRFDKYGYTTITAKIGDGYEGWRQHAPFDAIIVTCAPDNIPKPLIEQLKCGGRMVIPVGSAFGVQELVVVDKDNRGKITKRSVMAVRFVPMLRRK